MSAKDTFFSKKRTLNLNGSLLTLDTPVVMGILNVTPDSFFDGGKYTNETTILNRCETILNDGALIVDLGAYSSRPGADNIDEDEELNRLANALEIIRKTFPDIIISVDTFRSNVASRVVNDFGVQIINDISSGTLDPQMIETVGQLRVPYIMMHMLGTTETMHHTAHYENFICDILRFFADKIEIARTAGINDIIIDPGFGFSKTIEQNFTLLNRIKAFEVFDLPILAGLSRKSMIYKTLETTPLEALAGTIAANTLALLNGAEILRVHDVKEAVDAIKIVTAYKKS
jgi:dihydropteroate synthase